MPHYVILWNWTDQGIRAVKDSPKRLASFGTELEKVGGKLVGEYYTMGQYDGIVIVEAPSDETYAPVDMKDSNGNPIVNTIKSGRSVALNFEVFDRNNVEQTSTDGIQSSKQNKIDSGILQEDLVDAIEITSTEETSLRYDTDGGTFIQNCKTPSGQAGNRYSTIVTTVDRSSSIAAYFQLK